MKGKTVLGMSETVVVCFELIHEIWEDEGTLQLRWCRYSVVGKFIYAVQ